MNFGVNPNSEAKKNPNNVKRIRIWLIVAASAVLLIILASAAFVRVPVGHTGIMLTMGQVQDSALAEGWHFKMPFVQQVVSMDNRVQLLNSSGEGSTSDAQTLNFELATNYQLLRDRTFDVYRRVGTSYVSILLQPATSQVTKNVFARYKADELLSKREEVAAQILNDLNRDMQSYGITVTGFNIVNLQFSEEYNKAIEEKQIAAQNLLKAETEAQTARTKAEADKQVRILAAEAEAQEKMLRADAEAYALEVQKAALTDDLLRLRWLEKWDGKLPTYMTGDSDIMLVVPGRSDEILPATE